MAGDRCSILSLIFFQKSDPPSPLNCSDVLSCTTVADIFPTYPAPFQKPSGVKRKAPAYAKASDRQARRKDSKTIIYLLPRLSHKALWPVPVIVTFIITFISYYCLLIGSLIHFVILLIAP